MARKPKDVRALHGHRVITGSDLRATFVEEDDVQDNPLRQRRRILHGAVLVVLVGLISAGIIVALAVMNGQMTLPTPLRSSAAAAPPCPDASYDYVPPEKINLNVSNATNRPGLARSVADELAARKFVVGAVNNTSSGYRGVALIVSGAAGQSAAFTVQRNVPGSDYLQDGRTDPSVDVILSNDFLKLAKPELVDQTPGKLKCQQ